jgi:hypothetical protein
MSNELRGSFSKVRSTSFIRHSGSTRTRNTASSGRRRIHDSTAGCRTYRSRARLGGHSRPQFQNSLVLQIADNMSWQKGSHALKFGGGSGATCCTTSTSDRSTAS